MGSIRALTLAGAVAIGAIAPAAAADLLPPPPVVEAPVIAAVDTSGWYLRGDVGVGVNQMSGWRNSFSPNATGSLPAGPVAPGYFGIANSATIDAGVGYQINNWFRADVTGEYRTQAAYRGTEWWACPTCNGGAGLSGGDAYNAGVSSFLMMANGYVDLGTWYGVTPYVGAGVGFVRHTMSGLTDTAIGAATGGLAADTKKTNLAWALMTGLSFNVNDRLKMDLGYRYLNMGTFTSNPIVCADTTSCFFETQSFKLASHDFRLGFRYMLGDVSSGPVLAANAPIFGGPAPAPGPLVRKY
ncbi:MAG: porin family protein [Hyphomicrobiales bacterium]|nr:porin family protein [Hyphomicrobiales bacterium]